MIPQWCSIKRQVAVADQSFVSVEECYVNENQSIGFHIKWVSDGADMADARVYVNGTEYITITQDG